MISEIAEATINPKGEGGANVFFDQNFPENCTKMKEIGPTEDCRKGPAATLDPLMYWSQLFTVYSRLNLNVDRVLLMYQAVTSN